MRDRTFVVEVWAEDIKAASKANPEWCPIALALRRQGLRSVYVDPWEIRFIEESPDESQSFSFATPPEAMTFIDDFDEERPVAPFTLRLAPPSENA